MPVPLLVKMVNKGSTYLHVRRHVPYCMTRHSIQNTNPCQAASRAAGTRLCRGCYGSHAQAVREVETIRLPRWFMEYASVHNCVCTRSTRAKLIVLCHTHTVGWMACGALTGVPMMSWPESSSRHSGWPRAGVFS